MIPCCPSTTLAYAVGQVSPPYTHPYITATPEISMYGIEESDTFLILGSDGLWEALTEDEAALVVGGALDRREHRRASDL